MTDHSSARAQAVLQAHKTLLELAKGSRLEWDAVGDAALNWLIERGLIERIVNDRGVSYRATEHGCNAVLGRKWQSLH